jgi:hypothetical protein
VVGELLNDSPRLASGELAADAPLICDRSVALTIGGLARVDRNLHCTVTSARSCRCVASSRAKNSRAACRASVRTNTRSGSSRRSRDVRACVPRHGRGWVRAHLYECSFRKNLTDGLAVDANHVATAGAGGIEIAVNTPDGPAPVELFSSNYSDI